MFIHGRALMYQIHAEMEHTDTPTIYIQQMLACCVILVTTVMKLQPSLLLDRAMKVTPVCVFYFAVSFEFEAN